MIKPYFTIAWIGSPVVTESIDINRYDVAYALFVCHLTMSRSACATVVLANAAA
jgi:hypothetical protein